MHEPSHSPGFNRHPVLLLAIYFAIGIGIGRAIGSTPLIAAAVLFALLLASGIRRSLAGLLIPVCFIPLGALCYHIDKLAVSEARVGQLYSKGIIASYDPVEITGFLLSAPEPTPTGMVLRVRATKLFHRGSERSVTGDVRLFAETGGSDVAAEYEAMRLRYGSRVRVGCNLEREARYLNPGVASRLEILDQQGIDAVATVKSPLLIETLGAETVFEPMGWVYEQRRRLIDFFLANFSPPTAGVLIASLLGDKYFLDRETANLFREGGTFHVLVISGLHITFIGVLTLWLVSLITRRVRVQSLVTAILLWSYTIAVGAEIPVVRASVMFSVLLFARASFLPLSTLNSLGVCGLLLLVARPQDLFTASFQLTFVSVASIVGCAFPLIEKLRAIGRWTPSADTPFPALVSRTTTRLCELLYWNEDQWNIERKRNIWSANLFKKPYLGLKIATAFKTVAAYVFEGLLVSAVVQLWMMPLLIVHFHRVTPASLFLNLWVGLFLALESFAAIFAVVLGSVSGWLAAPLLWLTEILNSTMMFLPELISEFGFAGSRIPIYPEAGRIFYWLFSVAVLASGVAMYKWQPFTLKRVKVSRRVGYAALALATALLGAVILYHPLSSPSPDGRLRVDFLDVGQGDSALVTFPGGSTMLIDGGGNVGFLSDEEADFEPDIPRVGEFVVSEFLWEKGYSRLDYIVATHADSDHLQGLIDVARNFRIGTLVVSDLARNDVGYSELMSVAAVREIRVMYVARGDVLQVDGVSIEIIHPMSPPSAASDNNNSIVLRMQFGSRSCLFTGDIEREAEQMLVRSEAKVDADVIKVPHHGSRTSSTREFIDVVDAEIAIVPVGRRSMFGHPHREVIEGWVKSGAVLRTTGSEGTITVVTDGNYLSLETFAPP